MDEQRTIEAEPESITLDLLKAALIVVDMQNAFVKSGGYLDLAGRYLHDAKNYRALPETHCCPAPGGGQNHLFSDGLQCGPFR